MPRGINREYYNYRQPNGNNYFTHPFLQIYNYIMHSVDGKNPYLNTGIAPNGSLDNTFKFFKFINSASTKSVLFNPTIINNRGQMRIDWNNLDIFKNVIPLIGGSYVYKRSKESNR